MRLLVLATTVPFAGQLLAQGAPLTIDRITASGNALAGTAPVGPVWSPDSRRVAFLWNDQGGRQRDVWLVNAGEVSPRRLTELGAAEATWARDSKSLFVVRQDTVWRWNVEGGAGRPVASAPDPTDLTVSPDGKTLGFLSGGDLWFHDLATGKTTRATTIAVAPPSNIALGTYFRPDVEVGRYVWGGAMAPYAWSPDGKRIAMQIVDRRQVRTVPFPFYLDKETGANVLRRGYPGDANESRTLALLDVATLTTQTIALPDPTAVQIIGFEWSPRGTLLIDRESDTAEDRWLLLVDPTTRAVTEAWHDRRATRIYNAVSSTWHPNGTDILFVSDLDDRYRAYALSPGTRDPRPLSGAGFDVVGSRGAFTPQGHAPSKSIYLLTNEASPAERHVYRTSLEGGPAQRLTHRRGVYDPTLSPDGAWLALLHSSDVTPPELYLLNTATGSEQRVTRSPPAEFHEARLVAPRYVDFPHQSEPYRIHARVFEPTNIDRSKRHPIIFGPVYSNTVRNQWAGQYGLVQQLLVQRGYIVVQVDVRGSTGYGREYREKFLMDYGGKDLDDLESAIPYLAQLPYADTSRMGIWGSSYGGTLTVFMLFKKPGLFKAGVAGAPATDPNFFGADDVAITRRPETHPEAFQRGNALQYAKNLRDHLLIIHGMQDDVVPFKTSVVLAEELMKLGKDFDFAFAPAATHGWTARPHYARYLLTRMVNHFDRYLGPPSP